MWAKINIHWNDDQIFTIIIGVNVKFFTITIGVKIFATTKGEKGKNFVENSTIKRIRILCQWRAEKVRAVLAIGINCPWARRDLYCTTFVVTQDLYFSEGPLHLVASDNEQLGCTEDLIYSGSPRRPWTKNVSFRHMKWIKEWVYFSVWWWSITRKKKWQETSSLRVAHDAKFPSFFSGWY
jgi:hypothetical protein